MCLVRNILYNLVCPFKVWISRLICYFTFSPKDINIRFEACFVLCCDLFCLKFIHTISTGSVLIGSLFFKLFCFAKSPKAHNVFVVLRIINYAHFLYSKSFYELTSFQFVIFFLKSWRVAPTLCQGKYRPLYSFLCESQPCSLNTYRLEEPKWGPLLRKRIVVG